MIFSHERTSMPEGRYQRMVLSPRSARGTHPSSPYTIPHCGSTPTSRPSLHTPPSPHSDTDCNSERVRRSPLSSHVSLLPPKTSPHRYTVVLDLDETLIFHAAPGVVYQRPGLQELLHTISNKCELVLWTASTQDMGVRAQRAIDPKGVHFEHVIYRHPKWYKESLGYKHAKDLDLLGRDLSTTVIIENSPNCVRHQKQNAIMVPDFMGRDTSDSVLFTLADVLLSLFSSGMSVPQFVSTSPAIREVHLWQRNMYTGQPITTRAPGVFYYLARHPPTDESLFVAHPATTA
eukprot:Sspe_Gene.91372::Locus_62872_Transcript_1_1_Confidence_1.000_Length_1221::g.91372::m.91372